MKTSTIERPEWIDAKTAQRLFGIGRTTLHTQATAGTIKTSSLRMPGTARGKRLYSYESIKALIEANATGGSK